MIDAAIVDSVTSLMTMFSGPLPDGRIDLARNGNMLGGAAPFYRCYLCADGREVAVGAIETHFYRLLITAIGAPETLLARQHDKRHWLDDAATLKAIFATRPAAEWATLLEHSDACVAMVLTLGGRIRARTLGPADQERLRQMPPLHTALEMLTRPRSCSCGSQGSHSRHTDRRRGG